MATCILETRGPVKRFAAVLDEAAPLEGTVLASRMIPDRRLHLTEGRGCRLRKERPRQRSLL